MYTKYQKRVKGGIEPSGPDGKVEKLTDCTKATIDNLEI